MQGQESSPYSDIDTELIGVSIGDKFDYYWEYIYRLRDTDPYPGDFVESIEVTGMNLTIGEYSLHTTKANGFTGSSNHSFRLGDMNDKIVALDWDEWANSEPFKNTTENAGFNGTLDSRTFNRPNEFERKIVFEDIHSLDDEGYGGPLYQLELQQSIWDKKTGVLKYAKWNHTDILLNGSVHIRLSLSVYANNLHSPTIQIKESENDPTESVASYPSFMVSFLLIILSIRRVIRKSYI